MNLTDPLTLLFVITGVVWGSFASVLITRSPKKKSIRGRSHCPSCGVVIEPRDLIPLLSFLALRGRCRSCDAKIGWFYPFLELMSGVLFVCALSLESHHALLALFLGIILWLLFVIAVIDARTERIPDMFNIPFVILAGVYAYLTGGLDIAGPLVAVGFFAAQWLVSRGKWVGSGDIILALGIGLLVGDWPRVLLVLALAYIIGATVGVGLILTGYKKRTDHLPFAPFLALGTIIVLLWGDEILFRLFFGG
ncbi:MAG: prepilin peptidase [Candidatus Peribacteraceae bacterium]|jgi:leader peptidase (prepilin peptidase)/N-methyltransferase